LVLTAVGTLIPTFLQFILAARTRLFAPRKGPTHLFVFRLLLRHLGHLRRLLCWLPIARKHLTGRDDHVFHLADFRPRVVTDVADTVHITHDARLHATDFHEVAPEFAEGPKDGV
jgi:hypothetical protein